MPRISRPRRGGERMTDIEAVMWRLEELDPMYRTDMNLVLVLDRPVDRGSVMRRLEQVSYRVPRLRARVVPATLDPVPPRWELDPDFDLSHHVRHVAVEPTWASEDFWPAAQAVLAEPFDRQRPPWEAVFVDGLKGGQQGLILRMHHSYTDGIGAVKVALELFDLEAHPTPSQPARLPGPSVASRTGVGRAAEDLAFEIRRTAQTLWTVAPWTASALWQAAFAPERRERAIVEQAGSVWDQVRRALSPPSPVMAGRSAELTLAEIDLPLAALRSAARRCGATINDVFLSGLLGGLGRYHATHGASPPTVQLCMPVSMRSGENSDDLQNQVELALMPGPLRIGDPVERTRLVHEIAAQARGQPLLGLPEAASRLGAQVPGVHLLVARAARSVDVVASNLPGPPVPLYLSGARIDRMIPVGPRSGAGLNLTLLSYCDTAHVGVNIDPAATPDASSLRDCLKSGFSQVLACA